MNDDCVKLSITQGLSGLIEDTDVQGSGIEIDPPVVVMPNGLGSHEASFSGVRELRRHTL